MERLTELHCKKSDGYYAKCSEHCNDICDCNCEKWGEVVDRLGAYEDTGLEPEEVEQIKRAAVYMMFEDVAHFVRYTLSNFDELQKYKALGDYNRLCELKQADDEGRCVVLPCKVGDTIYMPVGTRWNKITGYEEDECDGFHIARDGVLQIKAKCYTGNHGTYGVPGKTAFLTREDAESAMKRR